VTAPSAASMALRRACWALRWAACEALPPLYSGQTLLLSFCLFLALLVGINQRGKTEALGSPVSLGRFLSALAYRRLTGL